MRGQAKNSSLSILIVAGFLVSSFFQPAYAAAAGRPIISGGTVKTADGQLLRGCHAHVCRDQNGNLSKFFTVMSNVTKMRDQAHMNVIRICCVTPAWGGLSDPSLTIPFVDSIVANCGAAGIYAIIDYHGPVLQDSSVWDLKNFWKLYAPRYKDKTFVLYELTNETFPPTAPDVIPSNGYTGWPGVAAYIAQTVKDIIRPVAPNTMILHCEPVGVSMNWGPYLASKYAPLAGITWNSGKDAWAFHTYVTDIVNTPASIIATQKYGTGIPVINTEWSFWEEGWTNATLEGCHYPAQWLERNGISWMVWQDRGPADQLASVMNYLLPDATSKGWTWWNAVPPSAPLNVIAQALDSYRSSLSWSKPADTGSGLLRYSIYRDNKEAGIALPSSFTFMDTGLAPNTTYSYQVSASARGNVEGPRSAAVQVTTPADITPPFAVLVTGAGDGTKVRVIFSEKVDRASATASANYSISGLALGTILLAADQKTLTIAAGAKMSKGVRYALAISNVKDLASPANVVPANTSYTFNYIDGVTVFRFFPRAGQAAKMQNGVFEATNGSPADGPYALIYQIPNVPTEGFYNVVSEATWLAQTNPANFDRGYRYFRYRGPDGSSCNIAELELYSGTLKLTGAPFGTPGSNQNSGNDYSKAFDGSTTTFFDYSQPNGGYAGLDLGQKSAVRHPSLGCDQKAGPIIDIRDNRTVRIIGLSARQTVRLSIFDLRGALLWSYAQESTGGCIQIGLDGADKTGISLTQGNYLVRIDADNGRTMQKMLMRE